MATDAGRYYSLFTLGMLVMFECTVVGSRIRNVKELRSLQTPKQGIQVSGHQRQPISCKAPCPWAYSACHDWHQYTFVLWSSVLQQAMRAGEKNCTQCRCTGMGAGRSCRAMRWRQAT